MNPQTLLQVFIKPLTGNTFVIQFDPNNLVSDLIDLISDREGVPIDNIRLRYSGRLLDRKKKISEYGILPDGTIVMW